MAVPYLACMALVAQIYSLPPRVLPSIQAVEGGGAGVVHHNTAEQGLSDEGAAVCGGDVWRSHDRSRVALALIT